MALGLWLLLLPFWNLLRGPQFVYWEEHWSGEGHVNL